MCSAVADLRPDLSADKYLSVLLFMWSRYQLYFPDAKTRRSPRSGYLRPVLSFHTCSQISGFSKPSPIRWFERVSAATSFYAAFRPLFRLGGRWSASIPC